MDAIIKGYSFSSMAPTPKFESTYLLNDLKPVFYGVPSVNLFCVDYARRLYDVNKGAMLWLHGNAKARDCHLRGEITLPIAALRRGKTHSG